MMGKGRWLVCDGFLTAYYANKAKSRLVNFYGWEDTPRPFPTTEGL